MATEINNNLNPKIKESLDARLAPVANVASLPDPNAAANFIPEGAIIYVQDVQLNYQAQESAPSVLAWVNIGGATTTSKTTGALNITPTTTVLDLSLVSPAIATCHSVVVTVVGGGSATIASITNAVAGEQVTFYIADAQQLTFVHKDYDVAGSNDIVMEDGFDMTINGRVTGNESVTFKNHGTAMCQWDAVQYIKKGDLITNFLDAIGVINNLTSTSTTSPLSAYQGNLLNQAIQGKVDNFNLGTHLAWTGTDPNVLYALPWAWEIWSGTRPKSIDPTTWIPGLYSTPADNYYWVDLRSTDQGAYLLPPQKDPTVFNNWIQIDQPLNNSKIVRYDIAADASLTAVGSNYNPRVDTTTANGDALVSAWNADGPATEKVSFTLPEGTYKVKVKINVVSDKHNDFTFNFYSINGLTTAAAGVPGTTVLKDIATVASPTTAWTDSDQASYEVEALLIIGSTAGVGDGVILGLTTTSSWAASSLNTTLAGYLEITKLK